MIDKLIWIKNLVFNSQQILGLWKNPLHFWKTEICKNRQISIIFWKKSNFLDKIQVFKDQFD